MTKNQLAVIGGGIAGLGPAWQLASRGWEVHLFEKSRVGAGASTRAAGMLAPVSEVTFAEDKLLRLSQFSHSLYPRWVEELQEATGIDLDFRREGALLVAIDRDDAEKLEHLYQFQRRLDLSVRRLDADELHEMEPGLAPTINYALHCPDDYQIDPLRMLAAMKKAFLAAGGVLHEETEVDQIHIEDDQVKGLSDAAGVHHRCSNLLVAPGAWARSLKGLPPGLLPHIRPVRGQMISLELGDPPLTRHVIRAPDAYMVPKSDGRLLIGATMEERGFRDNQTAGGIMDLLVGAFEALPGIYDAPLLETWTGFRPISLANEPAIGPTSVQGLFLSLGHGRNGIVLTPATAYGLAELLDQGSLPAELLPFAPTTS